MSIGQQHLHARFRLFKNLEPFPSRNRLKRYLDYLMYVLGVGAPLALLPQIVHLYSTQSADGLSLPTWVILGCINVLWAVYGIVHKARQIFLANCLMAIFDLVIVIGILTY